uniref:Photosystem I reaction center subunit XII n=1 Tax=Cyanidium sp. THAL103 TaxID=3027999 RepID=A0A9Y1MXW3_9RHOD|nr:photosystem I protein M [Cyanidium sp. THAL103]
MITDSQILVALIFALVPAILSFKLAISLSK